MPSPISAVPASCGASSILLSDLQQRVLPEVKYLVDGLLALNQARPCLLVGKTGSGKSTLARQLAVCVASGKPFLGHDVRQGEVAYATVEDTIASEQQNFATTGYDGANHCPIHLLIGENATLPNIKRTIAENPAVVLVVLETLADVLSRIGDSNSRDDVDRALLTFNKEVLIPNSHRLAVLGLHYLRKRSGDCLADCIMGSASWRGKADNIIAVRQYSETDTRRTIESENRVGTPIPRTFLEFDSRTKTSTLGLTVAADKLARRDHTSERVHEEIIRAFLSHPNASFEHDVLPVLSCNSDTARRVFRHMLEAGLVVRTGGTGKKNSPLLYSLAVAAPFEEEAILEKNNA